MRIVDLITIAFHKTISSITVYGYVVITGRKGHRLKLRPSLTYGCRMLVYTVYNACTHCIQCLYTLYNACTHCTMLVHTVQWLYTLFNDCTHCTMVVH